MLSQSSATHMNMFVVLNLFRSPVELLGEFLVLCVVLHQLPEEEGVHGGADPLPGVDAAVHPHRGLVTTPSLAPANLVSIKNVLSKKYE